MLKINFSDFWPDFNYKENWITSYLTKICDYELSPNPDILFFSAFGKEYKKFKCLKVFYTGENRRPNFRHCNFSISFDIDSYQKRNLRWPLYQLYTDIKQLTLPKNPKAIINRKTKFCNFIYSNKKAKMRIKFFKKLSRYKKVDSGGSVLNNLNYKVTDKLSFIQDYKFTIAFENFSYPGYTTEKILQPMQVHSVPIYWGNPYVHHDFNPKSFICVHDYKNLDQVVERIIELDQNENKYLEIVNESYFTNNTVPEHLQEERLLSFLKEIVHSV